MSLPRARAGRALRVALILVVLLAGLALLLPRLAAGPVRRALVEAAEEATGGRARLGDLGLSLSGTLALRDLAVDDAEGRPLVRLPSARARVGLSGLWSGSWPVEATLDGLELTLRQRADGSWALGEPRAAEGGAPVDGEEGAPPDAPAPSRRGEDLPVHGHLALTRGRVHLLGTEGELHGTIEELSVDRRQDATDAAFEMRGRWTDGDRPEPSLAVALGGEVTLVGPERIGARLELDSDAARGRAQTELRGLGAWLEAGAAAPASVEQLEGDLRLRPAELGQVLAALLTPETRAHLGQVDGEQHLVFDLAGRLGAADVDDLLTGLRGTLDAGLGRVATPWLDLGGQLALHRADQGWNADLDLTANGGSIEVLARALPATERGPEEAALGIELQAGQVGLRSELAPLLSYVHPGFAGLERVDGARLEGTFGCDLQLAYAGDLTSLLTPGPALLGALSGKGTFRVDGARLQQAPLVAELLAALGVAPDRELRVRPLEFAVDGGRLTYAGDWTWTIDDVQTTFSGSVGLDRTLDLAWNVPVGERLAARNEKLRALRGSTLAVPIGGTVERPRLDWNGAVSRLLADVARERARDELEEARGKLEGELGEKLEGIGLGTESDDEGVSAEGLLKEADRLWDAGEEASAAALYRRIRDEFKLTLVYALNRDRIKERGRHP